MIHLRQRRTTVLHDETFGALFRCKDWRPNSGLWRHGRLPLIMIRPEMLNDLAARLSALVAASPARDLEKNARALLGGLFSQLDLVPREEFEVQAALLEKAEQRLRVLEARISELEKRG